MKKIIVLGLVLLLMISSVFAVSVDDLQDTGVELDEVNLFQRLFGGLFFSTIVSDGTRTTIERGEYLDVSFRFKCDGAGLKQRFTVGYRASGSSSLQTYGQVIESSQACVEGQWYDAKLNNVQVPDFPDNQCGSVQEIMVKHERYVNSWVLDTDDATGNIQGFEGVKKIQVECTASVCDGLTGQTTGNTFCSDRDIVQLQYTDLVKDGQCVTNNKVLKNCALGCFEDGDAECIEQINGYVLSDNQCVQKSYRTNTDKPDNFYTTKVACEGNIIVTTQDDTSDTTDTTDSSDSSDDTTTDNTTDATGSSNTGSQGSTSNDGGSEDTRNIFQIFWDWIKSFFS